MVDVGEGGTRVEAVVDGAIKGTGERGGFGGGDVSECLGRLLDREGKRVGGGGGGGEIVRDIKVCVLLFVFCCLGFIIIEIIIDLIICFDNLGNKMLCLFGLHRRDAKKSP